MKLREEIRRNVCGHEHVLQMHGFYISKEEHRIRFDAVVDFDTPDRDALCRQLTEEVGRIAPGYSVEIAMDSDISD